MLACFLCSSFGSDYCLWFQECCLDNTNYFNVSAWVTENLIFPTDQH